jgi:LysM repeat protein
MFLLIVIASIMPVKAQSGSFKPAGLQLSDTDPYSLIAEVNALRVATGKIPYVISPILMSTAQNQADYMASIETITHVGPGGITTTERMLAAGYPLAGAISRGGIRSENIIAGTAMTVVEAVESWKGDDIHYNTMTSPNYVEIGAGMAVSGEDIYYVIDCARPIGSKLPYVTNTPEPTSEFDIAEQNTEGDSSGYVDLAGEGPLATSLFTTTPDINGKLYHIVKPGETLWLIAISYGVKIAEIRRLNYMSETDAIYPKEKLLIREGVFVTPLSPTPSMTLAATHTQVPTWTSPPSATALPVASVSAAPSSTLMGVGALVLACLLLMWLIVPAIRQSDENRRAGW